MDLTKCLTCGGELKEGTFYQTSTGYNHFDNYCKRQSDPTSHITANEHLARYKRAIKLADVLDAGGIPPEAADVFTANQWAMTAALVLNEDGSTGIRPPSDPTAKCAVELLRSRATCRQRMEGRENQQ